MSGPVQHLIGFPGIYRFDETYEGAFTRAVQLAKDTEVAVIVYEVRELITLAPVVPEPDPTPPKRYA
jgi:hypothetical protein